MNSFCKGCEYLKDNEDLIDCCTHKKFCERAYKEGLKTSEVVSSVIELPVNSETFYIFEVTNKYPIDSTYNICQKLSTTLDSVNCLFLPYDFCKLITPKTTTIKLTNKFYYRDDDYRLTAEDGTTFSNTVKDAISELCGSSVCAYNEFLVNIYKLKDDYREIDIN